MQMSGFPQIEMSGRYAGPHGDRGTPDHEGQYRQRTDALEAWFDSQVLAEKQNLRVGRITRDEYDRRIRVLKFRYKRSVADAPR
jgi:hypothetical protein